jgi:hypothetical protein
VNWRALTWVISGVSIVTLWLMGNKSKWGPALGIVNQAIWIVYVVGTKEWGLLAGVVIPLFVQVRNLRKWWRAT